MKRLRRLVPFGFALVLVVSACGGSDPTASPRPGGGSSSPSTVVDEVAAVTRTFEDYRKAALGKDGARAADLIADTVYPFYDGARDAALTASRQEVAALDPIKRITVVGMRGGTATDVLRSGNPEQLLAAAVDAGLVGEAGIMNVEIGEITVSGDEASAEALIQGEVAPFDLSFLRQDGGWKFDLLPLLELGFTGFQEAAKQRGLTVDQLVEATLTQRYGAEKYEQLISQPIGR